MEIEKSCMPRLTQLRSYEDLWSIYALNKFLHLCQIDMIGGFSDRYGNKFFLCFPSFYRFFPNVNIEA